MTEEEKTIENLKKLRNWNAARAQEYLAKSRSFTVAAQHYQDRIMELLTEEKDQCPTPQKN